MKRIIPILVLFFSFTACDFSPKLGYGMELTEILQEKYGTDEFQIKITNNKIIDISLSESKYSELSIDEQQKIASEISGIVNSLEEGPQLEEGKLTFVNKSGFLLFTTTTSISYDLELGRTM